MAVPETEHYRKALKQGDTLDTRPCIHWVQSKVGWIKAQQTRGGLLKVQFPLG